MNRNGATKNGKTTPEYWAWLNLRRRCNQSTAQFFKDYGGRGIRVCSRWMKFENFLQDMGRKPSDKHTIQRIDNDGDYTPSNCEWATRQDQARNRRTARLIVFAGVCRSLTQWAERIPISAEGLASRLEAGWPMELALKAPPVRHGFNRNGKSAKWSKL